MRPVGDLIGELAPALERWGLESVLSIERATSGTMNDTYLLQTGAGRAVLRRHRHRDHGRAEREHALIAHVRDRGIPVPAALPTQTGVLVAEVGGRLYSMFEYAAGRQVGRSALRVGHAHSLGATLAGIHDALTGAEPVKADAPHADPPRCADTIARLAELLALATSRPDPQPSDAWAARRMRDRIEWLSAQPDRALADGPAGQVIHGDYQDSNVFFDDAGQVCAVIDWDKAEIGHAGAEVVRALALMFALEPAASRAFVAGYRARRALPAAQLDDGAHRYGTGTLHDTWVYDSVYRNGDDRARRFIRPGPYVPFERQWQQVRDLLV